MKNGIKNTKHASKKKILPNIGQKLPTLAIIKPIADIIKSTQPNRFICVFFIFFLCYVNFVKPSNSRFIHLKCVVLFRKIKVKRRKLLMIWCTGNLFDCHRLG